MALHPLPDGTTRLVSRNRGTLRGLPNRVVLEAVIDPAALVMTRQMLRNLKAGAEGLARRRGPRLRRGGVSTGARFP